MYAAYKGGVHLLPISADVQSFAETLHDGRSTLFERDIKSL